MINACIYNKEGKLEGCITKSSIQRFYDSFSLIVKKAKELDIFEMVLPVLSIMDKMLLKSNQNYTADYLNCLKLISQKHRYQLPLQFSQIISRNYHDLLKHCCSNSVRDDVFNETINILRDNGIIYQGKDVQGYEGDKCIFEFNNIKIGIKISDKNDLYALWNDKNNEHQAIVYAGDRTYLIVENSLEVLMLAIKACIDDYKQEDEEIIDLSELSKELLLIADMLFKR